LDVTGMSVLGNDVYLIGFGGSIGNYYGKFYINNKHVPVTGSDKCTMAGIIAVNQ
jgi:hypothetical protein